MKIVFVIGAGASADFGHMPVGDQLARDIEHLMATELDRESRFPNGPVSNVLSMGGSPTST